MSAHELIIAAMPYSMGIAVAAAVALGWVAKAVTIRAYREKVRRLTRSVRELTESLDIVEFELQEERDLVGVLAEDLSDTRRCLRSVIADPLQGGTHHVAMDYVREVAARPLPGESTGAHAAITEEEDDRG